MILPSEIHAIKVFIYWNLTKSVWSVKALTGERKGLVIAHAKELALKNCLFKVSEKQRQGILKSKRKVVHAGVVGYLTDEHLNNNQKFISVTYNPYKFSTFVDRNDNSQPIHQANFVKLGPNRQVQAYI